MNVTLTVTACDNPAFVVIVAVTAPEYVPGDKFVLFHFIDVKNSITVKKITKPALHRLHIFSLGDKLFSTNGRPYNAR
jgi:hypothetical protein